MCKCDTFILFDRNGQNVRMAVGIFHILNIRRFQISNDSNKEGKGLIGIGAVISAQIKFTKN